MRRLSDDDDYGGDDGDATGAGVAGKEGGGDEDDGGDDDGDAAGVGVAG